MIRFIFLLCLVTLLLSGCGQVLPPQNDNPRWIKELVARFESAPVGNPPQSIFRYEYKGQFVYYVPAQCCDQMSILYDSNGKDICAPDGGLSGRGDGQCPDFLKERKDERLVWRDSR